jgi:hypothetical protein
MKFPSPFVAQLVNETGITGGDGSKVGYYAGMIVRCLHLHQPCDTQSTVGVDLLPNREHVYAAVWSRFGSDRSTSSPLVRSARAGDIDILCWAIDAVLAASILESYVRRLECKCRLLAGVFWLSLYLRPSIYWPREIRASQRVWWLS